MIISASSVTAVGGGVPANLRCPGCGQLGTFELLLGNAQDFALGTNIRIGERRCPNINCRALIFVVWQNNQILRSYPAVRIDFDKTNIPPQIVSAFEEAITSHANDCFIAAAIMVRKTLEGELSAKLANHRWLT